MNQGCVLPNAFGDLFFVEQDTLAILNVIQELADIDTTIRVNFFGVLVANTVFEEADHLGSVLKRIATIAGDLTILKLSAVLVSVVEIDHAFAVHVPATEFTLVDAVLVVKYPVSVKESVSELALAQMSLDAPLELALSVVHTVVELAFIRVSI